MEKRIYIVKGDITQADCECIVNAANSSLLGGGGVDGAIHRAAGKGLREECAALGGCKTGEAKITGGHNLKAPYVIHTVGPIYGGNESDAELLRSCYLNSLRVAADRGIHSVAFPAISTGAYGYPLREATRIALDSVVGWIESHEYYGMKAYFYCFDDLAYDTYRELYARTPLKLTPVLKDYVWGGNLLEKLFARDGEGKKVAESWEVSVHPDGLSGCVAGTLADFIKENPGAVSPAGGELPVLVKYIDAKQNLSVQVHPDDEFARREEGDNGKTETWYIVQADEGAGIYCGFKRDVTREEFERKLSEGGVEELLNFIPVHKGDCYLIKAGTVHAICAGCVICEVQQSSNVTYRVYDYNRKGVDGKPRQLHTEKAIKVMKLEQFRDETHGGEKTATAGGEIRLLTECEYFRCRELTLRGKYSESANRSFVAVNVTAGCGVLCGVPFSAGDSFFVPCGAEFTIEGEATVILTDCGVRAA